MSTLTLLSLLLLTLLLIGAALYAWHRHQRLLQSKAFLMGEAMRNGDFTFHLPVSGTSGERALLERLNRMSHDIGLMVAQNEMESWQKLTRVLTHEIMNATAPIGSICQSYLQHPAIRGTSLEEGIRAIRDTNATLSNFVSSYRKLTQLQEPVPTDICLNDFFADLRTLYPTLQWNIDLPSQRMLHIDGNLLRQVIINLVKNAQEAGATRMDIRWRRALCISNNGAPIPADIACDIFIPFFTTKSTGSGVGLSLSRQVLLMQGYDLLLTEVPVMGYHTTFLIQ